MRRAVDRRSLVEQCASSDHCAAVGVLAATIRRDNSAVSQSNSYVGSPPSLLRIFGSILYDIIALAAIWFFAALFVVIFRLGEAVDAGNVLFMIYLLAVAYIYFGFCWTRSGQTLGMKSWKIRLVTSETNQTIGWMQAATRCAAALLSFSALGLGFLWAIFDHKSRTWHDLLSGSHLRREST